MDNGILHFMATQGACFHEHTCFGLAEDRLHSFWQGKSPGQSSRTLRQELLHPGLHHVRYDDTAISIGGNSAYLQVFQKVESARLHMRPQCLKGCSDLFVTVASVVNDCIEKAPRLCNPALHSCSVALVTCHDVDAIQETSSLAVLYAMGVVLCLPQISMRKQRLPQKNAGTRSITHVATQTDLKELGPAVCPHQWHKVHPIHDLIAMEAYLISDPPLSFGRVSNHVDLLAGFARCWAADDALTLCASHAFHSCRQRRCVC
mmetsp:Transcript_33426/g.64810  ORF Transcript_33426/g.64810 Transcript_33426/m.64810 type:complete len:261 (-) Transcript_33426:442-1224(-)